MSENINIKSDVISGLAHGQAVVEARQTVDGECRILSVSASAVTVPGEVFTGEARYTGKVVFDCLAAIDDKVECISVVSEFSDKITSPSIVAGMNVTLLPEVINAEANNDGGAIKMVAVVDTALLAVLSREETGIATTDEGIYAETQPVETCMLRAEQSETVYLSDSVPCKAGEVLFATSKVVVSSTEASDGAIKVSGAVYTNVIVRGDDGMIGTERVVTPFVKDIAALGVASGNVAFAFAYVDSCSATPIAGENRLEIAVTLGMTALAVECAATQAVTDVFCADNELEVKTALADCCTVESPVTVTDTVDGQVSIGADRLAADTVLCVTGTFCTLSAAEITDGRVTVEGLVGGDIVYYNAEKNAADMLAFRLPFALPLSGHTDAASVAATATVTDVAVRVRRESVFDIKAEVAFCLRLSSQKTVNLVTEVQLGEPIPRPDASIIVHIAKPGETLWQAAKALCCSPERVAAQNSAKSPYAGGERLINFCNK